jgi:predicted SnoaL-like aldol condensation-catalyzing enzyme
MKVTSPALMTTLAFAEPTQSCSSPVEIVREFTNLLDNEKNYQEAASFLDDNFKFVSPMAKFDGKTDFLQRFPKFHKIAPSFDEVVVGKTEKEATRNGKKKIAMMTMKMKQTFEVNDAGKIVKISVAMAK